MLSRSLAPIALALACSSPAFAADSPTATPPAYTVQAVDLGGAYSGGFSMDYLAYDPATGAVWVPAGGTGEIDVVVGTKVEPIPGFATKEVESNGRKRILGPSSAAIGDGVVYVGNRGDSKICAIDARSHKVGVCGQIDSMPDGVAYVRSTHEVWVTAPRDRTIRILDASTLAEKGRLTFEGDPEGFAVDDEHGRFFTNLEDKDRTLVIDLKSHATVATWEPKCGEAGPRGLRYDTKSGNLFVACTSHIALLDTAHGGAVLSSIDTGDGVDDPDFDVTTRLLYVAASKAGKLTVARLDDHGALTSVAVVPIHPGARNGVVTREGAVYIGHSMADDATDLIVVSPSH